MHRDFSEKSKQDLLSMVDQIENEKWCDFTDWVGDRWYDFENWIDQLNLRNYVKNVNKYHRKVLDKNNTTRKTVEKIFTSVGKVDNSYREIFLNIEEALSGWDRYIKSLSEFVTPENGSFHSKEISERMGISLRDLEKRGWDCLRDQMVQNIDGELFFDEDLIYEYIKKTPAEMSDGEQAVLLEVISQLKDMVSVYRTLAVLGTDELGADILHYVSWVGDSEYQSFTAVSAHYNDIYVNLLNYMSEQSKDEKTFASSLVKLGLSEAVVSILGIETSENLDDLFGTNSLETYLAKYVSEYSTQYFCKLEATETKSLKASGKIDGVNDYIKDWLKNNDLRKTKEISPEYIDSDGNIVNKKDAPEYYDRQMSLAELKKELRASVNVYNGTFDLGNLGEINVTVGEAEAHTSISAGLYVIGSDGEKKFSPGINAEIGGSVTALEIGWENQLLGDEMLGLNADASVSVGEASASADATAQIFGEDGKLDVQLGASLEAEAIAAEAEGSVGMNVLGGEVGVTGGVNIGVGAHADVGYRDGIFKVDIGASLGVGVSLSVDVDVGGMINTVCDTAEAAWNGIQDGWDEFWSWF